MAPIIPIWPREIHTSASTLGVSVYISSIFWISISSSQIGNNSWCMPWMLSDYRINHSDLYKLLSTASGHRLAPWQPFPFSANKELKTNVRQIGAMFIPVKCYFRGERGWAWMIKGDHSQPHDLGKKSTMQPKNVNVNQYCRLNHQVLQLDFPHQKELLNTRFKLSFSRLT